MTDSRPSLPAQDAPGDASARERGLRFVRRIHRMRALGLGLGALCVAAVFHQHGAPALAWLALGIHGYVWPHVARWLASRSAWPARTERVNLAVDSALGGVWIALMHFSLLPSVLIATMLSVDKVGVGGPRFAARTTLGLALACAGTSAALGFPVSLDTPMPVVVACLPFLVAYPLAISGVMYRLGNRVAEQNRRLVELSQTDDLTGLGNRREGLGAAAQALARYRRTRAAAVLIVLDIDRFKDINDRYGHPAGDEILRVIAGMLRDLSRATDTAARYAGDEFLLVMPGADLAGAAQWAERLRARLAVHPFERAPGVACTVSLGAAACSAALADVEDWIQQADAALYRAKARGRDRIVAAPVSLPEAGTGMPGAGATA
jgi:diguanylate cyclase